MFRVIEHHNLLAHVAGLELDVLQLAYFPEQHGDRTQLANAAVEAARRASGAVPASASPRWAALPLLVREGSWHEARAVAMVTRDGAISAPRLVSASPQLAVLAAHQGEVQLALRVTAEVLPDGPNTEPGNTFLTAALRLQQTAAEIALGTGELPTARAWLEAHDRWLTWSGAVLGRAEGALGWARYHRADGNRSLARQQAEEALAHAAEPRQPLALIAVHRFLGTLDTEDRRFPDAEAHLSESLALADACAAPFERALTLLETAGLRAAAGRMDDARVLLAEVRSICEPLGARPTLERVAAQEVKLAAAAPPKRPQYPAGLTGREVEVLRLVAEGLSDAEVAERLFLSPRTVGTHLTAIYGKLGVNSRTAAAHFAVEQGLV